MGKISHVAEAAKSLLTLFSPCYGDFRTLVSNSEEKHNSVALELPVTLLDAEPSFTMLKVLKEINR